MEEHERQKFWAQFHLDADNIKDGPTCTECFSPTKLAVVAACTGKVLYLTSINSKHGVYNQVTESAVKDGTTLLYTCYVCEKTLPCPGYELEEE